MDARPMVLSVTSPGEHSSLGYSLVNKLEVSAAICYSQSYLPDARAGHNLLTEAAQ